MQNGLTFVCLHFQVVSLYKHAALTVYVQLHIINLQSMNYTFRISISNTTDKSQYQTLQNVNKHLHILKHPSVTDPEEL